MSAPTIVVDAMQLPTWSQQHRHADIIATDISDGNIDSHVEMVMPFASAEYGVNCDINNIIKLYRGDMLALTHCDAIVNAANPTLSDGGGICGKIFDASRRPAAVDVHNTHMNDDDADDNLKKACHSARRGKPVPIGEARVTHGYGALHAPFVIHAVGPCIKGDTATREEERQLSTTYAAAYKAAVDELIHGEQAIHSVAMCCIRYVMLQRMKCNYRGRHAGCRRRRHTDCS
jgi:O-acetyl-ADP-ribose deacetylase (regulator of RNase III)